MSFNVSAWSLLSFGDENCTTNKFVSISILGDEGVGLWVGVGGWVVIVVSVVVVVGMGWNRPSASMSSLLGGYTWFRNHTPGLSAAYASCTLGEDAVRIFKHIISSGLWSNIMLSRSPYTYIRNHSHKKHLTSHVHCLRRTAACQDLADKGNVAAFLDDASTCMTDSRLRLKYASVVHLAMCSLVESCFYLGMFWISLSSYTTPGRVANNINPGYFSLAATVLKPQQIPMFLHISARVWGRRWSPHTSEQTGSMLKPQ